MRFLMRIMSQLQMYVNAKRKLKLCLDCNETVIPRREISILNVIFYIIIGIIVYIFTKNKASVFIPIVLSIINSFLTKPKCPKCKGTNLSDLSGK